MSQRKAKRWEPPGRSPQEPESPEHLCIPPAQHAARATEMLLASREQSGRLRRRGGVRGHPARDPGEKGLRLHPG
jgi:hypothetical protein